MPEIAISTQPATTTSENSSATVSENNDTTTANENGLEIRETGNQKPETGSPAALSAPARQQRALARVHAERAPRCCHIKINGLRCGSPSLRGNVLCFFHDKWLNSAADDILPPLEDGNGVQFSLMYMVSRLRKECFRDGEANIAAVKQLLYALQTASHNLRYVNFDPKLKTSVSDPFAKDGEEERSC